MMIRSRILALAAAALVGFGSAGCALAQSVDPTAPDAVVQMCDVCRGNPMQARVTTHNANGEETIRMMCGACVHKHAQQSAGPVKHVNDPNNAVTQAGIHSAPVPHTKM